VEWLLQDNGKHNRKVLRASDLMNEQLPGPLLDDDPNNYCGRDRILQGRVDGGILYVAVYLRS